MKKFLVLAAVICCTFGLFAAELGYIQPTFGIGGAFYDHGGTAGIFGNQFGITVGADVVWVVFKNDGAAAGDLYVGMDLAFEYWVPTKHKYDTDPWHVMRLPLQAYVSYEFQVNAGPLEAVGPYLTQGFGLNFIAGKDDEGVDHFKPSYRWGLGGSLAFTGNWALKAGFGGDAGPGQNGWHWNSNSFFMVEGAYRF